MKSGRQHHHFEWRAAAGQPDFDTLSIVFRNGVVVAGGELALHATGVLDMSVGWLGLREWWSRPVATYVIRFGPFVGFECMWVAGSGVTLSCWSGGVSDERVSAAHEALVTRLDDGRDMVGLSSPLGPHGAELSWAIAIDAQ